MIFMEIQYVVRRDVVFLGMQWALCWWEGVPIFMGVLKGIDLCLDNLGVIKIHCQWDVWFSISHPTSQDKSVGRRVDFMFCSCGVGVWITIKRSMGSRKKSQEGSNSLKSIMGVVILTCTISSCNCCLISWILDCKKNKKL
jgi:hypothetical protein